jgi:hypothetical protein
MMDCLDTLLKSHRDSSVYSVDHLDVKHACCERALNIIRRRELRRI